AVGIVRVAVVVQHVPADGGVLVGGGAVVGRHRRVVDLGHAQADRGHVRVGAVAIHRLVGEAVAAEVVGAGRVGEGPAGIERERAVRGAVDQHGVQRIVIARDAVGVVRVAVVIQHVAADGGVFVGGRAVVGAPRRGG